MKYNLLNLAVRSILLMLIGILTFTPALAAMTLDPTFGTGGKFTRSFPDSTTTYNSSGRRIFVQPNGRIIALGDFTSRTIEGNLPGFRWFGLTTNGLLDGSYNESMSWTSNGFMSLRDAFMYADGRLQTHGGWTNLSGSSNVLNGRTNADGSSDANFTNQIGFSGGFGTASAGEIVVRNDGKLNAIIKDSNQLQLFRVNSDGTRDTTFGSNGIINVNFNKIARPSEGTLRLFALPDGKSLLYGRVPAGSGPEGLTSFFLARFTDNGQFDKSFGRNGFLIHAFTDNPVPNVTDVSLLPNGNLMLVGSVSSGDTDVWMMRLRPTGKPDPTFGTNGIVIYDILPGGSDFARSAVVGSDGKIRIVGDFGAPSTFLVARFSASGTYEEHTSIEFTVAAGSNGNDIALQSDGKILVIGQTKDPAAGNMFAVARLTE